MIKPTPEGIGFILATEKIRVFLSDPQILFREGIHFVLSGEDDFEVTGETTGNEEAYSLIENNPPNIAILSAYDNKTNGFDITRRVRRNLPSVYVILIMDKKDPEKGLPCHQERCQCLPH